MLSRGRVVDTLTGGDVAEANIVAAAVSAVHHVEAGERSGRKARRREPAGGTSSRRTTRPPFRWRSSRSSSRFTDTTTTRISCRRSTSTTFCMLATALGFIAMGQTIALLMAGVDLSVGPLAGFLVVVASFFVNDGQPWTMIATGFVLMLLGAVVVGAINGSSDPVREFHADRRDPCDVYRSAGLQLSSARRAGRIYQRVGDAGDQLSGRTDPAGLPRPGRVRPGGRIRAAERPGRLAAPGDRLRRGVGAARSDCRSTVSSSSATSARRYSPRSAP